MLITLGGKAGSGKGTVSKLIAEKLGYEIISIGGLKRKLAEGMGISISELNILGEKPENQKEFDLKYEEYQKSLDPNGKIILDSRLGFFCQPHALKVFLDVNDEIAAERIFGDSRTTDSFNSLEEAIIATKERNEQDGKRYIDLYNIDIWDKKNYDLIIDTSDKKPEEIANIIIQNLK